MAGSSNFLQWNPGAVNQEDDPTYAGDAQRSGGALNGQIFNSNLANKLFYQLSTFVTAFCNMLANKGYTVSDANVTTLQGILQNVLTSADSKQSLQVLGFASNLQVNCGVANAFQITLVGDSNISQANAAPGQEVTFLFFQDGAGYHEVNWGNGIATGPSVSIEPNTCGIVTFIADSNGWLRPKVAGVVQS